MDSSRWVGCPTLNKPARRIQHDELDGAGGIGEERRVGTALNSEHPPGHPIRNWQWPTALFQVLPGSAADGTRRWRSVNCHVRSAEDIPSRRPVCRLDHHKRIGHRYSRLSRSELKTKERDRGGACPLEELRGTAVAALLH
jgi:hypothetical protein